MCTDYDPYDLASPYNQEAYLLGRISELEGQLEAAQEMRAWLLSMDDPASEVGREARRVVTLNEIIKRAEELPE